MKKNLEINLTVLILSLTVLFSSCKSCNTNSANLPFFSQETVPAANLPQGAVMLNAAQSAISSYSVTAIPTTKSFIFNVKDFLNYISYFGTDISYLQFFLGYNSTLNSTTMIICAMNKTRGHSYLTNQGNDYVYGYNNQLVSSVNPVPFAMQSGNYSAVPITKVVDTVLFTDAYTMVNNYQPVVNYPANGTALSFLVNADDIQNYLTLSNMVYLQVYLAQDFNRLTLVFVGLDANGNLVLMSDATKKIFYVLEHCVPCPTCNVTLKGTNLENPQ